MIITLIMEYLFPRWTPSHEEISIRLRTLRVRGRV
jgi:hypothetical protein